MNKTLLHVAGGNGDVPDELIVLGSASGLPTRRRFASAYALTVASKIFLIDCGAPVSTLLYRHNLDPLDVKAIFLSHWHMDHIASLGLFLSQNGLLKRTTPLAIYGPRGTRGKIRRLLNDSFILSDGLSFPLQITNIEDEESYQEGLLKVTYFKTQHLEQSKLKNNFGSKAVAYGMVLDGPGWQIIYSGDLAPDEELRVGLGRCDLLIHEMAHVQPEIIADFVAAAQARQVLISHIGPEYDEAPEKIATAFAARYHGHLIVAEDGTRVALPGRH